MQLEAKSRMGENRFNVKRAEIRCRLYDGLIRSFEGKLFKYIYRFKLWETIS